MPVYLSVCMYVSAIYLSVCLCYLSVCLSVCLSVYLSVFLPDQFDLHGYMLTNDFSAIMVAIVIIPSCTACGSLGCACSVWIIAGRVAWGGSGGALMCL